MLTLIILLVVFSIICFVIWANKRWKEILKLQNDNKKLQDQISELTKERLEYLRKNNGLSEFTTEIIKKYVLVEDQVVLFDKMNKSFPVKKEPEKVVEKVVEKVETETHTIKFELSTVFGGRKRDIEGLISTANSLGLTDIKVNSFNAGPCDMGYILVCKGSANSFKQLKNLINDMD